MNKLTSVFLIVFTLAVIIAAFISGMHALPLAGMVLIIAAAIVLKKKFTSNITVDERIISVREKSSRAAIIAFTFAAVIPAVILVLAGKNYSPVLTAVGYTLQACVTFIMLVDVIFYYYYDRKSIGKENEK